MNKAGLHLSVAPDSGSAFDAAACRKAAAGALADQVERLLASSGLETAAQLAELERLIAVCRREKTQ